jgi:serine/threonine protein kinase
MLRAQGLDQRCIIKEFSGNLALQLAQKETESLGRMQSLLLAKDKAYQQGEWTKIASARSVQLRQDNANVATLMQELKQYPFVGMLGEVNLAELDDEWDPNEFYRALGVKPPSPNAIWLVYEYAGLSTIQAYAKPAVIKRSKLPPSRGFFGNVIEPPALPAFSERADFIIKGIIKGAIEAIAQLHEAGLVHRSIGRTSIYLSSTTQDKTEAVSVLNTRRQILRVKVADFGFSGLYKDSTQSEEFCTRARTFGLSFRKGDNNVATANFSIAEDMHALGFVFLALLLNSLAELPNPNFQVPNTDEDTLQRLLGEIFEKDMDQFRDYVEAEDIWTDLVQLLDENDRAGWKVLETLMLAREKASKNKDTQQLFSIRGLLNSPFFA